MNGPGFRVLPYGQCPAARELNWKLQLLNYMYIAQAVRALYFILKTILTLVTTSAWNLNCTGNRFVISQTLHNADKILHL